MKKLFIAVVMLGTGIHSFAQNCGSPHTIFRVPNDKTPSTVDKIGTAPQFEVLRHIKSQSEMYDRLKSAGSHSNEINSLFNSLGYNGVGDPEFGPNDIQHASLPYGAIGMMGSAGNTYKYSMVAVPNETRIDAWHINGANDECELYFIAECGNAFYYSNKPAPATVMVREKEIIRETEPSKIKVKVYARNREVEPCEWCRSCAAPGNGTVVEKTALLAEETVEEIPATNANDQYPVLNLYVDVDKKTFKKVKDYNIAPDGEDADEPVIKVVTK